MLYLVIGGSGSGKSEYAEALAMKLKGRRPGGRLYYVATMHSGDGESRRRIARHRLMRQGKGFETIECLMGVSRLQAGKEDVLLLECMSNLLANEMYMEGGGIRARDGAAAGQLRETVTAPLLTLGTQAGDLVVVTNQVFSDGVRYDMECEKYLELLGIVNAALAGAAEGVVEVVYTVPVILKPGQYI